MQYKVEVDHPMAIAPPHGYTVPADCETEARIKAFCLDNGFIANAILTHRGKRLVKMYTSILEVSDA